MGMKLGDALVFCIEKHGDVLAFLQQEFFLY
jgi:hypothetical protein